MSYIPRTAVKNFDDLNAWLKKVRKIRFKETREEMKDTSVLNLYKRISDLTNNQTFYVRGKQQCETHRDRSIYDFVRLVKYYNPDFTYETILMELVRVFKFYEYNSASCKLLAYCPDIYKHNIRIYGFVDSYYLRNYCFGPIRKDLFILFPNLDEGLVEKFIDLKLKTIKYIPKEE